MTKLVELRKLRFEHRQIGYDLAEIRSKLRGNNNHRGLIAARVKKMAQLKELELRVSELKAELIASPYSRIDVVELLDKLISIESAIVDQGYEGGLEALRAFIEWTASEQERLEQKK